MIKHNDPLGLAYLSYLNGNEDAYFTLYSSEFDPDDIPVNHFFRDFSEMPELEKKAMSLCKGKVLDIGAGSGVHSLFLQEKGFDVTALEISEGAVEVMKKRGVKNIVHQDFYKYSAETFDTILLLMNGIGIIQTVEGFAKFFEQVSKQLNPEGQILLDSSDLAYLFEEDDGSFLIPIGGKYYGEVDFKVGFEDYVSEEFSWVYVDFETLKTASELAGFECELIQEGEHYDFLARLTIK